MTTKGRHTPIYAAARNGHLDVVEALVFNHSNINKPCSNDKATPMHAAAKSGHLHIVRVLAALGANRSAADRYKRTPRDVALARGYAKIVDWLDSAEHLSPLEIAAACRLYKIAAFMVRSGKVDPLQETSPLQLRLLAKTVTFSAENRQDCRHMQRFVRLAMSP